MNDKKVKICGITSLEIAIQTAKAGADFLGFVFYKDSPRNINYKIAESIGKNSELSELKNCKKVIVTCNASEELLDSAIRLLKPDYIQFHGEETSRNIIDIKSRYNIKAIKSFRLDDDFDFSRIEKYNNVADYFLFDSHVKNSNLPGGTGKSFNWRLLKDKEFALDYFLAGGLDINNIKSAMEITSARLYDFSSGLETIVGKKDIKKVRDIITMVKSF